ncbi:MAG: peptide-methionine (R)-S-oxide reductase MsrB [Desulfuromonas sp.]|nr:peptide-methionine (R)-S-oxide reductase MsrB [Desulfuromonas sp.]
MNRRYMSVLTWLLVLLPIPSLTVAAAPRWEKATFAGGCFWCMENPFEKIAGVKEVVSGFSGGVEVEPSYNEVAAGKTGHMEAVEIEYDANLVSYAQLVEVFWRQIDPTDDGGQFVDRGEHYRTAIFYRNKEQQRVAEQSKDQLNSSGRFAVPIVTRILPFSAFYPAEEYHQNFHEKSPQRYCSYRNYSGRDQFLEQAWGKNNSNSNNSGVALQNEKFAAHKFVKPSDSSLRKQLTKLQYAVTQQAATEKPFANEFNGNKAAGLYVDIVSGEPLFSSKDKFDSGTGWPSFVRAVEKDFIVEKQDRHLFMLRTEVRSKLADSHLGHVFNDGPAPTGLRYCINSAALRFIPLDEMESAGYAEWLPAVK